MPDSPATPGSSSVAGPGAVKDTALQTGSRESLESVGRLAAGVAHEINTPIQFVGDSVHFLREAWADMLSVLQAYREIQDVLGACPDARAALERLRQLEQDAELDLLLEEVPLALDRTADGTERVASIVRAMKSVTHPGQRGLAPHDLNQAVEAALIVARNEYKYCAELDLELGEVPLVPCDLTAIHQVLLNLITNAAHAIQQRDEPDPGRIQVQTHADTDCAVILIRDSGVGIEPEHIDRIWEPFFTTKEVGQGTGQGLHVAHRIVVEQHHGGLVCHSTPGEGTTFTIRLPLIQGEDSGPGPSL